MAGPPKTLGSDESAVLRDRLLAELKDLVSADDAALWAQRSLGEKNKLTHDDAQRVKDAFRARLAVFSSRADDDASAKPLLDRPPKVKRTHRGAQPSRPHLGHQNSRTGRRRGWRLRLGRCPLRPRSAGS